MSESSNKERVVFGNRSPNRAMLVLCAVLLLSLVVVGFLWWRAGQERDQLVRERDELQRRVDALELALQQANAHEKDPQPRCDPSELQAVRDELQQVLDQSATYKAQAEAATRPDHVEPIPVPNKAADCPKTPRLSVQARDTVDEECRATLARERELRQTCERELNSEIREDVR